MTWEVIKCFLDQWKALMECKNKEAGLPPKLNKNAPVHKWLELMVHFFGNKVGECNIQLSYIIRPMENVQAIAPPCQAGGSHTLRCTSRLRET